MQLSGLVFLVCVSSAACFDIDIASPKLCAAFMASRLTLVAAALLTAKSSVRREVVNLSALYISVPFAAALCLPTMTQLLLGVSWDALCVWCAWIEYGSWCTAFRSRRSRRDSDCPSANMPPRIGKRQQSEWLEHEAPSMWKLAAREVKSRLLLTQAVFRGFNAPPPSPSSHPPLSTLLRRSSSLCPANLPVAKEKNRASPTSCPLDEALSPLHAVSLDMNHLYLSWTQFFWGRVFVTYAFSSRPSLAELNPSVCSALVLTGWVVEWALTLAGFDPRVIHAKCSLSFCSRHPVPPPCTQLCILTMALSKATFALKPRRVSVRMIVFAMAGLKGQFASRRACSFAQLLMATRFCPRTLSAS